MPRFIFFVSLLYLFSGCSTTTPAITQYTLLPSNHISDQNLVHSTKSLKIVTTETLPSLGSKSIRYTLKDSESGAYLYGRWSDTPALMLTHLLASSLESEKLFSLIMTSHSSTKNDWILESELMAFDHRFLNNNPSQGIIDLSCRLIDTKTQQTIAAKRFIISTDARTNDIHGGVSALQQSSDELVRQQIAWLKSIIKNIK